MSRKSFSDGTDIKNGTDIKKWSAGRPRPAFHPDAGRARGGGHSKQAELFIAEGRRLLRVVSFNDRSPTRLGQNLAGQMLCQ